VVHEITREEIKKCMVDVLLGF